MIYFRIELKSNIKNILIYKYPSLKILEILIEIIIYIDFYIYKRELERKIKINKYRNKISKSNS
jgi:hypothetical protein